MKGPLAVVLFAAALGAHAQNPFIEAARAAASSAPREAVAAATLVRVFVEGCIAHDGESMKTVDWAINQGFDASDAHLGPGASLLSGRPGTVMALPGSGGASLLLAIDLDKRCTVWADRSDGPAVRAEFGKAIAALTARGARVQPVLERSIERAGAWRHQLQMRVRRAGGTRDFDVGSVTTLTPQPAAQVLSLAPLSADAAAAPAR